VQRLLKTGEATAADLCFSLQVLWRVGGWVRGCVLRGAWCVGVLVWDGCSLPTYKPTHIFDHHHGCILNIAM